MSEFTAEIKKIEDFSLNAWPSFQMQVYDGWILRFSYFYTHRTNCVEQIGNTILPPSEKIPECENIYRRWGTPAIFKITPVGDPDLDRILDSRGYHIEHTTEVMTSILDDSCTRDSSGYRFHIEERVSDSWIRSLFRLKGVTNPDHIRVVPQMYAAIPKDEIAVSWAPEGDNSPVLATGLGILDRNFVGVYAIHTDPSVRRQGIASAIVRTILAEARKKGAEYAYLQVVSDNMPAKRLYRRLGFSDYYRCWFRVKEV